MRRASRFRSGSKVEGVPAETVRQPVGLVMASDGRSLRRRIAARAVAGFDHDLMCAVAYAAVAAPRTERRSEPRVNLGLPVAW